MCGDVSGNELRGFVRIKRCLACVILKRYCHSLDHFPGQQLIAALVQLPFKIVLARPLILQTHRMRHTQYLGAGQLIGTLVDQLGERFARYQAVNKFAVEATGQLAQLSQ